MGFLNKPSGRWLVWGLFATLWTIVLVVPLPDLQLPAPLTGPGRFHFSKTLHVAAYAFLAGLGGWLKLAARDRLLLLVFLMAHAPLTEFIQLHVPGRTGRVEDVLLDHLGIGIGLALSWKWWTRQD
jgi:VanZ family protein